MNNKELLNVLFKGNNLPYCFYGTYSRLGLDFSMVGKLQVHIAKVLEGGDAAKGKAEKGVAKYDNEHRADFTLDANECFHITENIKDLLNGTYSDPNPSCPEKYKSSLKITHFPSKETTSQFILNNTDFGLKVTIVTESKESYSFVLAYNKTGKVPRYDRSVFLNFVDNAARNAPYDIQMFKTKVKTLRNMIREAMDEEAKNSGSNNYKGTNNYEKRTEQVTSKPKPEPVSVPSSHSSDEEDDEEIPF